LERLGKHEADLEHDHVHIRARSEHNDDLDHYHHEHALDNLDHNEKHDDDNQRLDVVNRYYAEHDLVYHDLDD